jgi:hypothetical protein
MLRSITDTTATKITTTQMAGLNATAICNLSATEALNLTAGQGGASGAAGVDSSRLFVRWSRVQPPLKRHYDSA